MDSNNQKLAFAVIDDETINNENDNDVNNEQDSVYVEPENVFASDLPKWSIEPPMTVVRGRKKK